jgi:glycosyltransferase involved in cell wall biosynthesis
MSDTPEVSVVMSVFNGAPQLPETLESILSQVGTRLELIVVNDGSTDASRDVLDEYASRDSRVRVIDQTNQGLTRALIVGCRQSRADYIARHDVGDVSHSRRMLLQKGALDSDKDLAFVSCWTEYCGPEWEFLYLMRGTTSAAQPMAIISRSAEHGVLDGPTHHGSTMFRRGAYEAAAGYRPQFYYGQDWDLWHRLAVIGNFLTVQETLYRARVTPGSISNANRRLQRTCARLSRAALEMRLDGRADDEALKTASEIRPSNLYGPSNRRKADGLYFIGECLRRNNDSRSKRYFKESIRRNPLLLKAWLRLLQSYTSQVNGLPRGAHNTGVKS